MSKRRGNQEIFQKRTFYKISSKGKLISQLTIILGGYEYHLVIISKFASRYFSVLPRSLVVKNYTANFGTGGYFDTGEGVDNKKQRPGQIVCLLVFYWRLWSRKPEF